MLYQLSYTPAGRRASTDPTLSWQDDIAAGAGGALNPPSRNGPSFGNGATVHAPAQPMIPLNLLLLAYRSGIFPMADHRDDPDVFWVEPKNRAIIPLDGFHLSASLAKALRQGRFRVTCNAAFTDVLAECAAPREEHAESWISRRIEASYRALHDAGHAHSIECWQTEKNGREILAGGLYGVGFGRVFCGESMFSRRTNASKVALAWLVAALRHGGTQLLDCQFMTGHLATLGAVEVTQDAYVERLQAALGKPGSSADLPAAYASLSSAALDAVAAGAASSPGNFIAQSLTQTS